MVSLLLSVASVMLSTGMAVGALNPAMMILGGFFNETHMVSSKITSQFLFATNIMDCCQKADGMLGILKIKFGQ